MAWRGVLLTQPAALRVDRGGCLIETGDGPIRLAFEDLAYIVLDTPEASLTSALLGRLAEAGVLVVACDAKHLPVGALLPLQGHFRQTQTLRAQLALTDGVRRRLWQRLVQAKLRNQGAALLTLGHPDGNALVAMAGRVEPGDPDNLEAQAARDYFAALFDDFRRRREGDCRNAMLNYAYALLRAGIARGLAAQGFHPAIGLHHDNVDNAFNLADDLIEPFRPVADLHVARLWAGRKADAGPDLRPADKRELARLLVAECRMGAETTTVLVAIERVVDGLLAAMRERDPARLPLPEPA